MGKVVEIDCEKPMKLETSPKVTKSKRSLHWCRSISKKYLCTFYYSISQKVITLSGRRFITVSGVLLHYRAVITLSGVFYYIIGQLLQYRAFITLSVGTMPLNGLRSLSNFTIGTFKVRGLSSATKRDQLSEDLNRLHIDVCFIQETKCPSGVDVISGYYRLIDLPSTSRHYGLAFAVASLADGLLRYWSVSDRLAVIQLSLGSHSTLTIVNAYGPSSQVTLRNQDTQDDFYAALDS